jgi:hypothetical protein
MRWIAAIGVVGMLLFAVPAQATTGMVLHSEYVFEGMVNAPTYCYNEDDVHTRQWQGTLAAGESFSVPLRFCTTAEWPYGPSMLGIMFGVSFWSGHQTVDLHVVFPDGHSQQSHVQQPGFLWGCVNPEIRRDPFRPDGVLVQSIPAGTYQVVLTNTGNKAISTQHPLVFGVGVDMANIAHQEGNCPVEDQRIDP